MTTHDDDLVVLRKDLEGSVSVDELHEIDEADAGELLALEAELGMLLAEQDIEEIGTVLEPGAVAAVLVYENCWAGPFGSAVRPVGRPVGGGRPDPDPGAAGRDRGGTRNRQGRSLTCRLALDALADEECSAGDPSPEPPRWWARPWSSSTDTTGARTVATTGATGATDGSDEAEGPGSVTGAPVQLLESRAGALMTTAPASPAPPASRPDGRPRRHRRGRSRYARRGRR